MILPPGEPRPWDARTELAVVGKPHPRVEAAAKVTGAAKYTHDVLPPNVLHGAVLRCPHACATVEAIDVEPAKSSPGVSAAIALTKPGERLLFAGQDVAAVAASTPELAAAALARIAVRYKPEPFVVDTARAMEDGAPIVHRGKVEERTTEGDEPGAGGSAGQRGNVRTTPSMKKGDVGKGLRAARFTHDATYTTQVHTHAALETHSIVVQWEDKSRATVWCSTQGIFSVRDEFAEVFGLKPADVRVHTDFLGGGFGAKFGASAPGSRIGFIAGELARQAKAPVRVILDRREEHLCTGNRPDSRQKVTLGATADGLLTAVHVHAHGTGGVGTGAGVGRNAFGIYSVCPNILVESHDVFTHAGPATAMRAPGHPQGAFALELAIDELAAKLKLDPLDLRLRHNEHPVRKHQFERGRKEFGWDAARKQSAALRAKNARVRRGVGVAASIWGDFGRGKAVVATVSVGRDGTVEVRNGLQDIGGGITTVVAQIAAEVLGRRVEAVRVRLGDSELGPSVGSGGSLTTASVTPAVRAAAEGAKAQLTALAARLFDKRPEDIVWQGDAAKAGSKSIAWADLCKKIEGEAIVATGTRPDTYGAYPMKFMGGNMYQIAGVQFAEVTVDTWTGVVGVERVLALHDCGRVMNPLTARSQVNGGVILGTSYALTETRVMDRTHGVMLNADLERYKIAGARDVPRKIDVVFTEVHTGANNTGAIGIGEPATIPTAAAIACAVFDALGAPVRDLPLTPDRVLAALGAVPARGAT